MARVLDATVVFLATDNGDTVEVSEVDFVALTKAGALIEYGSTTINDKPYITLCALASADQMKTAFAKKD